MLDDEHSFKCGVLQIDWSKVIEEPDVESLAEGLQARYAHIDHIRSQVYGRREELREYDIQQKYLPRIPVRMCTRNIRPYYECKWDFQSLTFSHTVAVNVASLILVHTVAV